MTSDQHKLIELTTPRLLIRHWREDEAERLFDIRSRPDIAKWLGDPNPWSDIATATEAIHSWRNGAKGPPHLGAWAIVPTTTGISAGTVLLEYLPNDTQAQIGWFLHPDSVGNGYATEAAAAILAHAFNYSVNRVWAIMWPDNEPSARVAESIGMTDLGVLNDRWYGTNEEPQSRMFRAEAPK